MMGYGKLGENIPKVSCVYFLFNDIELVYIGQTKNLRTRVMHHNNFLNPNITVGDKKFGIDMFDSFYYLRVEDQKERRRIEKFYYDKYDPKCNFCGLFTGIISGDISFKDKQEYMEMVRRERNPVKR